METAYKKKQMERFLRPGRLHEAHGSLFRREEVGDARSNKQKIAVVYAVGEITEGKSSSSMFGGSTLGSTTMVESINKAFDDPKVVAVVLRDR